MFQSYSFILSPPTPLLPPLCPQACSLSLHFHCRVCWVTQSCPTLCDPMDCRPPGTSVHADSPGKSTGAGCHALLQGIFPTQGLNPGLLNSWWILYHLSHQQSPRILEWAAFPFSRGSSQSRNQTGVSCTAGGFFYQLQPTPVFLPGKPCGQRSMVGYSPWGHKESDMTECLHCCPANRFISTILEDI